jgi:phosphoglycolate phosphatase-like HAD superfamily hydrolase
LLKILNGRDPATAIYLGDNVDDSIASQSARVPFLGILPKNSEARRARSALLKKYGAMAILDDVSDLDAWLKRHRPTNAGTSLVPRA